MKILIVTERYWPEVGAAPSRLSNMAEGMTKAGCDVDVLTGLPNYPQGRIFKGYRHCVSRKEVQNGIRIFRYWLFATVSRRPFLRVINMFSFAFMLWLFAFKRRTIKSYDKVIIQTPTLVTAASAMVLFKKLYRKRCVLNVSDIWPSTAVDMGVMKEGSTSYRFLSRLEHFLYRNADAVLGQSSEILAHVEACRPDVPRFLYRNLQHYAISSGRTKKSSPLKVAYCGMLGVAQDVAGLVKSIPFKDLGAEFHIFGGGKQLKEIESYIAAHSDVPVVAHGFVAKEDIPARLADVDVCIVPLKQRIRGAVPSKIYDLLPQGIPILFCGGGEGATFIKEHGVGMISAPSDTDALCHNIREMVAMSAADYAALSARCIEVSCAELDFHGQMERTIAFLKTI